ncbi:MAG: DUF4012 domain-containing protein, partial [Actinomycetia bacterium]|nr:DUF4012 domain-containing protein [Actinomycetes bacterium]
MTRRTQSALGELDVGPERGLMSSLADARKRFTNELAEADKLLAEVETATAGLEEFLEGPNTYLLLAGNNSEMRAGSGAYLMAGTVRVVDGEVEVGELRPTGDIPIARGAVEVADEDLAARWGWLDIAVDWRNLSPSPRFPASAELAAAMWSELENEEVDGVIVLDPVALSAIMGETGPVELDGRSIGATDVVRELLFDQYWEEDIDIRRDRLREIAG